MNITNTQLDGALQPGNMMMLSNGTLLPLYPREQSLEGTDNEMRLDTTGTYLSLRKKPHPQPASEDTEAKEKEDRKFFLDNVFFFVAHADEILSDSRMFLAPVPVQNGLAYTGTGGFRHPTLGVYLEWWMQNGRAVVKDKTGKVSIYWFISGSPLSGANACAVVDEQGEIQKLPISPFIGFWNTFMDLNTRYDPCKVAGEAFSLREVKDRLLQAGTLSGGYLDRAYRNALSWLTDWMIKDKEKMVKSRKLLLLNTHADELRQTVAEYHALKQKNDSEIARLRAEMQENKRRLKSGEISSKEYQQQHTPMKEKIESLDYAPRDLLYSKLYSLNINRDITPNELLAWAEESNKETFTDA